jgi:predicted lysophospholipase L1 biosynthesis ABC-type transport system permease subunit
VPGSGDPAALLVDLTDWTGPEEPSAVERPREVWAWPTGDGIPAALAEAGLEVTVTTTDPAAAPLLDPALTAFRLAGWATVALAAGGLLAAARASSRARRSEIGMLRGLGVGGDVQARLRVSEQVRVLLPAVLLGAAAGAGLSALVVAPLVGALDGAAVSLPVPFAVDLPDLLVRIGILLLAGAAVTAGVAHDTRGRARTASPREVIP